MFTFASKNGSVIQENKLYIEKRTHLVVLEQKNDNEIWGRYIRMTLQQVRRMKEMFLKGGFSSGTKPCNTFSINGDIITMCCREENQVIRLSIEECGNLFRYSEIHEQHIAHFDKDFRR